jgi:hypothetical protein
MSRPAERFMPFDHATSAAAVVKYAQPERSKESGGGGPGTLATAAAPPGARRVR